MQKQRYVYCELEVYKHFNKYHVQKSYLVLEVIVFFQFLQETSFKSLQTTLDVQSIILIDKMA